jgi:hypothetical protein
MLHSLAKIILMEAGLSFADRWTYTKPVTFCKLALLGSAYDVRGEENNMCMMMSLYSV